MKTVSFFFPHGSIPACTGEPILSSLAVALDGVYPRVYGGTFDIVALSVPINGLSPRVRGNLHRTDSGVEISGSIPACTGEPEQ